MTRPDSSHGQHPEDLLDRARTGLPIDPAEQRQVEEHLAACPICAAQVRYASVADAPERATATDAYLDRIAKHRVLQRLAPAGRRRPVSVSGRWAQVAIAVLLLSGTAAAASWWSVRSGWRPWLLLADRARTGSADSPIGDARPERVLPVAPRAAEDEPPTGQVAGGDPRGQDPVPHGKAASAAELFERARALRIGGQLAAARSSYRDLQRRHPDSREAHLSHLLLGRMFLDAGSPELAVRQFAAYLERGGDASEEALFGRASALRRMGRWQDEAADWRSLLAQNPHSLYGARARARLDELRQASGDVSRDR